MRSVILALAAVLLPSAAPACDQPFSVFQNGPDAILKLILKQAGGTALTKNEAALVGEFNADQRQYWKLKVQSEPVCTEGVDPHNCISQCKDRPAQVVQAAHFKEGALRYSLPPQQRAELHKQERALEKSGKSGAMSNRRAVAPWSVSSLSSVQREAQPVAIRIG